MKIADLAGSCSALLDDFLAQFEALGAIIPPTAYVAAGIIPWDGESLTLYLGNIFQGQPGAPIGTSFNPADTINLSVEVFVQILRPTSGLMGGGTLPSMLPSESEMNASGLQNLRDAQALLQAAINIHEGYLASDPGEGFVIGPVAPLGPDGGLQGCRIRLDISLS